MPIDSRHPQYEQALPTWQMCNDFTLGTRAVKAGREKYLPRPNPDDRSSLANERYNNYLKRAVFYEYSSKTVNQYLGLAFKQDPICELDESLAYLKDNANGEGVSIYQLAQKGFKGLMVNGRFGLWVDYTNIPKPKNDKGQEIELSRTELKRQNLQGRIKLLYYTAEQIINWHTSNGRLSKVILHEIVQEVAQDGYAVQNVEQYRELGLDKGMYYVRVWRRGEQGFGLVSEHYPKKANGQHWSNIPFVVFGSQFNTFDSQDIPIEPLVHIEHGIYCNSADAENSRFLCGQAQPFMNTDAQTVDYYTRLDEKGNKVNPLRLGSETVIMLGEHGSFGFAQAQPNSMATQGILEKREIIAELGYQLGQSGGVIKTATQSDNETQAQHSQASLCVANINEGMHKALLWVYDYVQAKDEPKFMIRQQFAPAVVDVGILSVLNQLVDGGKLPKSVIWNKAKEFNLLDSELSDDDIIGLIEAEYETGGITGTLQATPSQRVPFDGRTDNQGA